MHNLPRKNVDTLYRLNSWAYTPHYVGQMVPTIAKKNEVYITAMKNQVEKYSTAIQATHSIGKAKK